MERTQELVARHPVFTMVVALVALPLLPLIGSALGVVAVALTGGAL